jgi:hypothetical protein
MLSQTQALAFVFPVPFSQRACGRQAHGVRVNHAMPASPAPVMTARFHLRGESRSLPAPSQFADSRIRITRRATPPAFKSHS